jgi:V8-like Glu-specific endopeptidase
MDLRPIEGPMVNRWKGTRATTEATRLAQEQQDPRSLRDAMDDPAFEKIIEKNNLRGIAFLEKGVQISRAVGFIVVPGVGVATGFLVDDDILMTNNHVFPDAETAQAATVRFNFQKDLQGSDLPVDEYELDPEGFFWTSPESQLDCSVVRVKGNPGSRWGVIPIPRLSRMATGQDVVIVQHPAGRAKEIALTDNEVVYADEQVAQYLTDTEPGSSGSPVFDDDWTLVALHHSGGWIPEPSTQSTHFRNEGIRISAIRTALPNWR